MTDVIDVYFWPTGNGRKITIMLEECGLEYRIVPINIGRGDQFEAPFTGINPNGKIPAIVDHDVQGAPLALFESGAILQYLAERTGRFLPTDLRGRYRVLQWLYWQVGGLGPMAGQAHHFMKYAPVTIDYCVHRFGQEVARLYGVMDRCLADADHLAGEYSIADIAAWPWVYRHEWQGVDLAEFPNVQRWFAAVGERPGVVRGVAAGQELAASGATFSDEEKKRLFGLRDEDFSEGGRPGSAKRP